MKGHTMSLSADCATCRLCDPEQVISPLWGCHRALVKVQLESGCGSITNSIPNTASCHAFYLEVMFHASRVRGCFCEVPAHVVSTVPSGSVLSQGKSSGAERSAQCQATPCRLPMSLGCNCLLL